jgi:hypothetical protein
MKNLLKDFVSKEPRDFSFKVGRDLASSLSGFISGAIVASIIWITCLVIAN